MEKKYSDKETRRLLERFMSGETTIEEEDRLGEYFRTAHDIPAEWQEYKLMFGYFDSGMDATTVDKNAGDETAAAETATDESAERKSIAAETLSFGPKLLIVHRYAAVAAAILLLVGIAVVMTYDNGTGQTFRRDVNRPALVAEQKNEQKVGLKTERAAEHNENQKVEQDMGQKTPQSGSQTVPRAEDVRHDRPRQDSSGHVSRPAPMKKTAVTVKEQDSQEEYENIEREIINQYVIAEYNARREEGQCCILVENVDGYYELENCASDVILM